MTVTHGSEGHQWTTLLWWGSTGLAHACPAQVRPCVSAQGGGDGVSTSPQHQKTCGGNASSGDYLPEGACPPRARQQQEG
eukprot:15448877-Alexandrium_andersonii.AAC.1